MSRWLPCTRTARRRVCAVSSRFARAWSCSAGSGLRDSLRAVRARLPFRLPAEPFFQRRVLRVRSAWLQWPRPLPLLLRGSVRAHREPARQVPATQPAPAPRAPAVPSSAARHAAPLLGLRACADAAAQALGSAALGCGESAFLSRSVGSLFQRVAARSMTRFPGLHDPENCLLHTYRHSRVHGSTRDHPRGVIFGLDVGLGMGDFRFTLFALIIDSIGVCRLTRTP